MDRWQTFLALPRPSASGAYGVEATSRACRVARSHEDFPAVLLAIEAGSHASAPRRLATIAYHPPRLIELSGDGVPREASQLAVLECRSTDPQLGEYFFRIVDSVLLEGGEAIDAARFDAALDAVVTLFRALQRPGRRSIQGLWAELAVILWAKDAAGALAAWHSDPRALHDFAAGSFRLEVKSTLKPDREHQFLLDQLSSMSPGVTLIASVQLADDDRGAGVLELVALVAQRVGPGSELARRLEVIVADSLGEGWRDADAIRFSLRRARRSLMLYRSEDIPTVAQPIPPQVKDVRFTADLSGTASLEVGAARTIAPVFDAILPEAGTDG